MKFMSKIHISPFRSCKIRSGPIPLKKFGGIFYSTLLILQGSPERLWFELFKRKTITKIYDDNSKSILEFKKYIKNNDLSNAYEIDLVKGKISDK